MKRILELTNQTIPLPTPDGMPGYIVSLPEGTDPARCVVHVLVLRTDGGERYEHHREHPWQHLAAGTMIFNETPMVAVMNDSGAVVEGATVIVEGP